MAAISGIPTHSASASNSVNSARGCCGNAGNTALSTSFCSGSITNRRTDLELGSTFVVHVSIFDLRPHADGRGGQRENGVWKGGIGTPIRD